MGTDFIQCTSRIYFRTSPILYFCVWCIFHRFYSFEIDFASFVDDNTPFASSDKLDDVLHSLENTALKPFDWFPNNQMRANHLLASSTASMSINIKDNEILNSESEKLLGATLGNKFDSNNHLQIILKKAKQKVHVLAGITPYISIPKRKLLRNSFFISQFNYCPLV